MKLSWLLLLALPLCGQKRMAVTIDDLPWVEQAGSTARAREGTADLLRVLKQARVPAVGFVNANKIEEHAEPEAWSAMLEQWMKAGFDLGNHTFAHRDLNKVDLEEYKQEVIDGERPWRPWMKRQRPDAAIYFRHPFTHTGGSKEKREEFEKFLAGRGYRVAPFTIENADYLFEYVRWKLEGKGDNEGVTRVEAAYLEHTAAMITYFEKLSRSYFGRDIAQILLIHTNELNRRMSGRLFEAMRRDGYEFVSLDEALRDAAYRTEDRYYGKHGPSWVHRWSIALGREMDLRNEPDAPGWVLDLYNKFQAEGRR